MLNAGKLFELKNLNTLKLFSDIYDCFFGHLWADFGFVSRVSAERIWCQCTYMTLKCWEKDSRKFRSTVFRKIEKSAKRAVLGQLWANFGSVFQLPAIPFWCHCTYRTLIWCRMAVENFVWIVWTVFGKTEKSPKVVDVCWKILD